jgi:beta-N-acetylhexosaminidase
MEEMRAVAGAAGPLAGRPLERAERALAARREPDATAEVEARAEFAGHFEAAA